MSRPLKGLVLVLISAAACAAIPAAASAAPSISGTIKGLESGTGAAGVEACAEEQFTFKEVCSALTGSDGKYKIENLVEGARYQVFFLPQQGSEYLFQVYKEHDLFPAEPEYVQATAGDVPNIDAKLKKGGMIDGQVTDAETHLGILDAEFCISKFPSGNETCFGVGPGGNYTSPALPPGQYTVAFQGGEGSAYLRLYYDQETDFEDAAPITLTAGVTKTGVNAALSKGSSIAGHLTALGSGADLAAIDVCLYNAASGEIVGECKLTNSFGLYKFSALPLGDYKVGFSEEPDPIFKDGYDTQFYDGKATLAEATAIQFTSAEDRTGIDAQLHKTGGGEENPPPSGGGENPPAGGGGSQTTMPPPATSPRPLKCKKGFQKKKVKGKAKCVKRKKRKKK